jgi:hypothetical protein
MDMGYMGSGFFMDSRVGGFLFDVDRFTLC